MGHGSFQSVVAMIVGVYHGSQTISLIDTLLHHMKMKESEVKVKSVDVDYLI